MSELLKFAGEHPILTFFLVWMLTWAAVQPFALAFRAYNRTLRSRNIIAQGWPKAPLDADGGIVHPKKGEQP